MLAVIRVDSSSVIGSGHLMRCLTLAERLRRERSAEVLFVSRNLPGNLTALVQAHGFELALLNRAKDDCSLIGYAVWLTVSQERDAEETIAAIQEKVELTSAEKGNIDLLVVDSYALDENWESLLRPYAKEIMVIDDLANRKHDCDILLDQNLQEHDGEHRYDGLVPKHCCLLLGPRHALLRDEFYKARRTLRQRTGKIRRILVFYGGADLTDETSKAVRALISLHEEGIDEGCVGRSLQSGFTADIIVGGSNPRREAVHDLCAPHGFLNYHCQVNNMAEYMADADLMLGAGGTTTWERCYLGLPVLVTSIAENQHHGSRVFAEAGYSFYLGRSEDVTVRDIKSVLQKMTPKQLIAYQTAGEKLMGVNEL